MPASTRKQMLEKMHASKQRTAAKSSAASPTAKKAFKQLNSWDLSGEKDACILCDSQSSTFSQCPFSMICPFPCGLFVAQTAGEGERPGKGAILCESCHVDIAPKTMYWPRTDDGGMRCYNHVKASECLPKSTDAGKCGGCGTAADNRFVIGPVGCTDGDKLLCRGCFILGRTDNLVACQPTAITKRANNNKTTSPAKRARTS